MSTIEKAEIVIVLTIGLSVFFLSNNIVIKIGLGRLFLYASALLLLQSLIRDLWILFSSRSIKLRHQKKIRCVCLESSIGMVGVLVGAILLGLGVDQNLALIDKWAITILLMVVLGIGYYIKDYVFQWNPWRIYRDKDHLNIVFVWKE